MTFQEFVHTAFMFRSDLSRGEASMRLLLMSRPDLHKHLAGTTHDPSLCRDNTDDPRIADFLDWLERSWNVES